MNGFLMAMRFQWWLVGSTMDGKQPFIMAPLFAVIFVGMTRAAGREDLVANSALGAVLVSLWSICIAMGGNIIDAERWSGTFEPLVTAIVPLRVVVMGRVTTIALMAVAVVPEVWLTVLIVFRHPIAVPHPGLFLVTMVFVLAGLAATASLVAALFVLAREATYLQNAATYPLYILGGLLVPVAQLPGWLQPASRVVFLSWGGDLMRAALRPGPPTHVAIHIGALVTTTILTFGLGQFALGRVLDRARRQGSLSLA